MADKSPSLEEILKNRPANLHKGSASVHKEVDIDDMIDKSGCSKIYFELEECLGENDRKWSKCQTEVKNLRKCSDAVNALKNVK